MKTFAQNLEGGGFLIYRTPDLQSVEVRIEHGFAGSGGPQISDAGSVSYDEATGNISGNDPDLD